MTHSTHFIYGYMGSNIWHKGQLIGHERGSPLPPQGLLFPILLYATYRQDNTYHSLCYSTYGAQAGTRNKSMGPP